MGLSLWRSRIKGGTMISIAYEQPVQHRLMACEWNEEGQVGVVEEDEHVLTAADFVVDEFELYGCGD